jgi:Tol biopolymer transport system component/DNA-binding winged helix-turn-helix (wHTH) protein
MTARFGAFTLDAKSYRLMKNGRGVRLARQPLDLLILLVRRRGELVTREDIEAALWEPGTYVDSEHGINAAVRRIRAALVDDAATPKYIRTVPRRGYQFVAPVTIEEDEGALPPSVPVVPEPACSEELVLVETAPQERFGPRRMRLIGTITAIVCAAVALLSAIRWRGEPLPPSYKPITKAIHPIRRISSDGRNVYWSEYEGSGCRPWQAPIGGSGEAVPVPMPFPRAYVTDASRDGDLLLTVPETCIDTDFHTIQGAVWELNPASGRTTRLGDLSGQEAEWSPGGRFIAVARFRELWLANQDGSGAQAIATLPGDIQNMHWSPDGRLLRFCLVANAQWNYPLWEIEIASRKAAEVLPEWQAGSEKLGGAWSASGEYIFGAARSTGIDLWGLALRPWPLSGYRLRQLTQGPLDFAAPVAIPGRRELAALGTRKLGQLEKFDSRVGHFVPFLDGISAEMVDFSQDGRWIAYVSYPERDLWRRRADGSDALQLTHGPLHAGVPKISPDSRWVVFTGDYSGKQLRTWLVPLNGGEPHTTTNLAAGAAEVAPKWSPDGKKLLFRFDRAAGPKVLQILDVPSGTIETLPGSENKFNQRWSPDGKWIAATPYGGAGLLLFDLGRRQWTELTSMRADYPAWSRNGDSISFVTRLEGDQKAIYRVVLASHESEKVASLTGQMMAMDEVYGHWMGLAPDDSPMILRSADLQQIYLLSLDGR